MHKSKKGQSILEYGLLLAIVVAVLVAIQLYVKRSVQGRFKQSADQIGEQFTTGTAYTSQVISQSARREVTDPSMAAAKGWTNSEVQATNAIPTAATEPYSGYEATKTDYVVQSIGAGTKGTHGTFDSGKISDVKLFEDD